MILSNDRFDDWPLQRRCLRGVVPSIVVLLERWFVANSLGGFFPYHPMTPRMFDNLDTLTVWRLRVVVCLRNPDSSVDSEAVRDDLFRYLGLWAPRIVERL